MPTMTRVINAAGKLTALGGSAQSDAVAAAMAKSATEHVDLAALRAFAGQRVAELTGAQAACITTGAAAGIAIGTAALTCGADLAKVRGLPLVERRHSIALLAGHAINFGASIEQMIRIGGGTPLLVGDTNAVPAQLLDDCLAGCTGFLYVQSHHCVQDNMVPLELCIELCQKHGVPIMVDAAAEESLTRYIELGADLVTYSGGKAFSGPTSGFIAGGTDLIANCELQFRGIARTMKVGKEQIFGLLVALTAFAAIDENEKRLALINRNESLMAKLADLSAIQVTPKADEAGRDFERLAVSARHEAFPIRALTEFLAQGDPSIRTRNHHLDQGYLLIDPRELKPGDIEIVAQRIRVFTSTL